MIHIHCEFAMAACLSKVSGNDTSSSDSHPSVASPSLATLSLLIATASVSEIPIRDTSAFDKGGSLCTILPISSSGACAVSVPTVKHDAALSMF